MAKYEVERTPISWRISLKGIQNTVHHIGSVYIGSNPAFNSWCDECEISTELGVTKKRAERALIEHWKSAHKEDPTDD